MVWITPLQQEWRIMSKIGARLWSRRQLLKGSGVVSAAGAAAVLAPVTAHAVGAEGQTLSRKGTEGHNLFTEIGVRPILNARGTYTIISGSRSLPEVKQAMYEASFYYVHLDEMMDGIGAELGKLTGAEWGIATPGGEAAIGLV